MPRGTNGRQAERSEVATTKVLEVALELFSTQGYGATSMRQIATESGRVELAPARIVAKCSPRSAPRVCSRSGM